MFLLYPGRGALLEVRKADRQEGWEGKEAKKEGRKEGRERRIHE